MLIHKDAGCVHSVLQWLLFPHLRWHRRVDVNEQKPLFLVAQFGDHLTRRVDD